MYWIDSKYTLKGPMDRLGSWFMQLIGRMLRNVLFANLASPTHAQQKSTDNISDDWSDWHPRVSKLARNLFSGEVILIRDSHQKMVVDRIEVLSKVITDRNGPKRVLVWSTDDLHYTFGIDESVEIAHA